MSTLSSSIFDELEPRSLDETSLPLCRLQQDRTGGSIVLDYLRELARHCTVFYLADGQLEDTDVRLLREVCEDAWVIDHGKYDFGSYSELARNLVGWERLECFDEVILANDSCFCLQPFDAVFTAMSREDCDFWCLLGTDEDNKERLYTFDEYVATPSKRIPRFCFGSYFLALRPRLIRDLDFRAFLDSVRKQPDRNAVCVRYEMGLTRFLRERGFRLSAYIKTVHRNVAIYDEQAFRLLKRGFPLLKTRIFTTNPLGLENLEDWVSVVSDHVGNDRIVSYLEQVRFEPKPKRALSTRKRMADALYGWLPPLVREGPRVTVSLLAPPVLLAGYRRARRRARRGVSRLNGVRYTPRKVVDAILTKVCRSDALVIFFNLAYDTIGGGMLSINRFVSASIGLGRELGFDVLVSGVPLNEDVIEYSMFEGAAPMVPFSEIAARLRPKQVVIHLPECEIRTFLQQLTPSELRWMKSRPRLRLNIMDQNHDLLPGREFIERLRDITDEVTLTTAHLPCTSSLTASETDCPVGLLTPFLPALRCVPFAEKERTIVLSPDPGPGESEGISRQAILDSLTRSLPDYRLVTVENMPLETYEQLISQARFTLTFGEGYDGYFVESFLSGSVAFAVYNDRFFPDEFSKAPTVYGSWRALRERISADIRGLETDSERYRSVQQSTERMIRRYANDDLSMANLRDFYAGRFSYVPEVFRAEQSHSTQADAARPEGVATRPFRGH